MDVLNPVQKCVHKRAFFMLSLCTGLRCFSVRSVLISSMFSLSTSGRFLIMNAILSLPSISNSAYSFSSFSLFSVFLVFRSNFFDAGASGPVFWVTSLLRRITVALNHGLVTLGFKPGAESVLVPVSVD